ncbi:MAG: hypothetical protein K2I22_11270 [Lachnospiraceae bacterium]|nr:hypothetical protein [Lachnospiraceae bacterium]
MAKGADSYAVEKKKLQDEKKKLKSEQKNHKKEAKKRAKEIAAQEAELSEDEEGGGIFTFLATLAIIAVWIGIVCVVIKLDVGGFGSNVLRPLLKDVPVVNKILPEEKKGTPSQSGSNWSSDSEKDEQIRNLELEIQRLQTENLQKDELIANLQAENARLKSFEDMQTEFQRVKTEFFENVIYAENGPGPEAYKEYYEAMDPATAEYLYKQVVAQLEEDRDIVEAAETFAAMKPAQAAKVCEEMATTDMNLVARILSTMSTEDRGKILGVMDAEVAAKLFKIMVP